MKGTEKQAVRDTPCGLFHELCMVPEQFGAEMMGNGIQNCQKISSAAEGSQCPKGGSGMGMDNCIYNLTVTGEWAVL